jgi:hypothetical protein
VLAGEVFAAVDELNRAMKRCGDVDMDVLLEIEELKTTGENCLRVRLRAAVRAHVERP